LLFVFKVHLIYNKKGDAMDTLQTYGQKLLMVTFSVHHNPNCAKPFQVRLIGKGMAVLDNLPVRHTKDICGYGMTFEEAAKEAWLKKNTVSKRKVVGASRTRED
jgi:hypothetical protein